MGLGGIHIWHMLILLLVVVLVFGVSVWPVRVRIWEPPSGIFVKPCVTMKIIRNKQ